MLDRRVLFSALAAMALAPGLAAGQATPPAGEGSAAPAGDAAIRRLLELGPENEALAQRAGEWT